MAIPRSPPIDRSAASTNLMPPRPLDDPEDPEDPEAFETPMPRTPDGNHDDEDPPPPVDSNQDPVAELARLRQAFQQAQQLIATLQRGNTSTPAPAYHEPKVNKPAEFGGKLSEYSTFMSQCLLTFSMCPISYPDDEKKVFFVISYLIGTPRNWARPILENEEHPYRKNFPAFKKALDAMYADRNLKQKALDKLGRLEQTKSVAAYAAEFQQTIAPLDLDLPSKQSMFYRGLDSDIKKSLIYFPPAQTFDELLEQCVSIDQRQYAFRQEEKHAAKSSKPHSKSPRHDDKSKPSNHGSSSHGQSISYPKQRQSSQPHPPISEDEKNRRRENNLCFRCGSSEHRVNGCPLNKGKVPNRPTSNGQSSNVQVPEYPNPAFPPENWPSQVTTRPVP